jgi:hypothetical protein
MPTLTLRSGNTAEGCGKAFKQLPVLVLETAEQTRGPWRLVGA